GRAAVETSLSGENIEPGGLSQASRSGSKLVSTSVEAAALRMSPETPLGSVVISWAGFRTRGTMRATGPTLATERVGNTRGLRRVHCRAVFARAGEQP